MTSQQHLFGYLRAIRINSLLLPTKLCSFSKQPTEINAPSMPSSPPSNTSSGYARKKKEASILSRDIVVYQHISSMETAKLSVGRLFRFLFEVVSLP
jgi:hypothetical protein